MEYTLNATKLYWPRQLDHKPLLLLATALLPNRTTASFESEAGPPYDKQRIQMGLRSGNTVLICFRSGVGHFQSVLIALAADLHTNKPWQGQRKFWKYVSPIRTYFAWLPERLARTYCSAALDKCPEIPYGEVHHLQGSDEDEKHSLVFQNIYHIGDTKSAQELEVFLRMSRERLRLCCGLQCTDRLHPNGPRQRQKLYHAALKLLWFAIGIESVQCENAAQVALHAAIRPLLRLEDANGSGHGWLGVFPAVVDWTRLARWTPESCRPICPTRKASVSGSASGTPLAGCLLTKSKLLLVLIVISRRIQFERYLWISALPTLICSLDPRNLPEAKLTKLSSKRSRILWRSLRRRP